MRDSRPSNAQFSTQAWGPRFTANTRDQCSTFGRAKTWGSRFSTKMWAPCFFARMRDSRWGARPAQTWPSHFNKQMWSLRPASKGQEEGWTEKPSPQWVRGWFFRYLYNRSVGLLDKEMECPLNHSSMLLWATHHGTTLQVPLELSYEQTVDLQPVVSDPPSNWVKRRRSHKKRSFFDVEYPDATFNMVV